MTRTTSNSIYCGAKLPLSEPASSRRCYLPRLLSLQPPPLSSCRGPPRIIAASAPTAYPPSLALHYSAKQGRAAVRASQPPSFLYVKTVSKKKNEDKAKNLTMLETHRLFICQQTHSHFNSTSFYSSLFLFFFLLIPILSTGGAVKKALGKVTHCVHSLCPGPVCTHTSPTSAS